MKLQLLKSTIASRYGYGMKKFRQMLVDAGIDNKNKVLTPREYERFQNEYGKPLRVEC